MTLAEAADGGPGDEDAAAEAQRWGVWAAGPEAAEHQVRLSVAGEEVRGSFGSREEALRFQTEVLKERLGWPRRPGEMEVLERHPTWDHPEELEPMKEYSFQSTVALREALPPLSKRKAAAGEVRTHLLDQAQLRAFDERGFLMGLPVLEPDELTRVQREFEELLESRIGNAPDEASTFRAAHTMVRPLHQDLVHRLAAHPRVLGIIGDVLGPRFVCWSAHLFCKLPGDPTAQPWHQDAGFWPLSQSRALTLWLAFDDVDAENSSVMYVEGSHRLARLPWQRTGSEHVLLTQEIPDVDLLGRAVSTELRAGEAAIHCDLTVHGSQGNSSARRRGGLALRFVGSDANCLGPMINGYRMNAGCILPNGPKSDPRGHWKQIRRRPGRGSRLAIRFKPGSREELEAQAREVRKARQDHPCPSCQGTGQYGKCRDCQGKGHTMEEAALVAEPELAQEAEPELGHP